MKSYNLFIGNRWIKPSSGNWLETSNPYTGEPWAQIPRCDTTDVDLAVRTAHEASQGWADSKPAERAALLYKLAELIDGNSAYLAEIEVKDNGKLYAEMSVQTRYIAEWYRYFAGLADKIEGVVVPNEKPDIFNFTCYEPLGVVALITPWNSPLLILALKLAAALAAGNVAVIKPSEFASASTLEFMSLIEQAGFPPGVVNVITGYGVEAGAALVEHPLIAKVSFTGSDTAGQTIYEAAARGIKRVSLELGGKSPNIVFEDADMDAAVIGAISGIFAASGQTCVAGSRLLLQESIHDEFVGRLLDIASKARIGDPMLPETNVGPVTTELQYQKVLRYIEAANNEGAKCVLGGKPYTGPGAKGSQCLEPTIFTGVKNRMTIAQEEVFGPVLAVIKFRDEDEAVQIANDVRFGLAAGIWTSDIGRAFRVSSRVQAGNIWVNTYRSISYSSPFGGYKRSGIGREGGQEAVKEWLQAKSVWISTAPSTADPFILK